MPVSLYKTGDLVGQIKQHSGTAVPSNHLLCYGQSLATGNYPALAKVLWNGSAFIYGGTGTPASGTFNLPDLRGRTVVGKDDMGGPAANRMIGANPNSIIGTTLGATGGKELHALSYGESGLVNHSHPNTAYVDSFDANHDHNIEFNLGYSGNWDGISCARGNFGLPGDPNGLNKQHVAMDSTAQYSTPQGVPPVKSLNHTHTMHLTNNDNTAVAATSHNNTPPGIILNYIIRF